VTLQNICQVALTHLSESASGPLLFFYQSGRLGRSIERQHPASFRTASLPGMRHAAWNEGGGAGTADGQFVADHEGDLATQNSFVPFRREGLLDNDQTHPLRHARGSAPSGGTWWVGIETRWETLPARGQGGAQPPVDVHTATGVSAGSLYNSRTFSRSSRDRVSSDTCPRSRVMISQDLGHVEFGWG
jgi:hypothetical protein